MMNLQQVNMLILLYISTRWPPQHLEPSVFLIGLEPNMHPNSQFHARWFRNKTIPITSTNFASQFSTCIHSLGLDHLDSKNSHGVTSTHVPYKLHDLAHAVLVWHLNNNQLYRFKSTINWTLNIHMHTHIHTHSLTLPKGEKSVWRSSALTVGTSPLTHKWHCGGLQNEIGKTIGQQRSIKYDWSGHSEQQTCPQTGNG